MELSPEKRREAALALARAENNNKQDQELRARAVEALATAVQNVESFSAYPFLRDANKTYLYIKTGELAEVDDLPSRPVP